jgi:nicotinamidase-related amidase
MTTLSDRPDTALMVIDVQKGPVAHAHQRDAVVANIGTLVGKARDEGVTIVWVQHFDENLEKGSDAWEYVPEPARHESEPLVHKSFATPSRTPTRIRCWPRPGRTPARDRRVDGRMHPVHHPRRFHARLRRDARR